MEFNNYQLWQQSGDWDICIPKEDRDERAFLADVMETAVYAIKNYPDMSPEEFCRKIITEWDSKDNEGFYDGDHTKPHLREIDGKRLSPKEIESLIRDQITHFQQAGCTTEDRNHDWKPGIVEWYENYLVVRHQEYLDAVRKQDEERMEEYMALVDQDEDDDDPYFEFEATIQKRGTGIAIYIPKKIERDSNLKPGERVRIYMENL